MKCVCPMCLTWCLTFCSTHPTTQNSQKFFFLLKTKCKIGTSHFTLKCAWYSCVSPSQRELLSMRQCKVVSNPNKVNILILVKASLSQNTTSGTTCEVGQYFDCWIWLINHLDYFLAPVTVWGARCWGKKINSARVLRPTYCMYMVIKQWIQWQNVSIYNHKDWKLRKYIRYIYLIWVKWVQGYYRCMSKIDQWVYIFVLYSDSQWNYVYD